jgi:hypothetical protein
LIFSHKADIDLGQRWRMLLYHHLLIDDVHVVFIVVAANSSTYIGCTSIVLIRVSVSCGRRVILLSIDRLLPRWLLKLLLVLLCLMFQEEGFLSEYGRACNVDAAAAH